MTPEQRLAQSAPRRLRATPWDDGVAVAATAPQAPTMGLLARVRRWWTARQSRRHPGMPPSLDAVLAAITYYDGRYQNLLPDPAAFRELVKMWGSPDWPNPFPENTLPHFRIHPLGFLAADLEVVLEGWWEKQDASGQDGHEPVLASNGLASNGSRPHAGSHLTPIDPDSPGIHWPSFEESQQQVRQSDMHHRQEAQRLARVCWAMLMQHGTGVHHLMGQVHASNLSMALEECLAEPTLAAWELEPAAVLAGAQRQGIDRPAEQPAFPG